MKKQFVLPLVAMFIATPIWARQHRGTTSSISVSATALSFNGSTGNITTQPLTITAAGQRSVTIQGISISNGVFTDSTSAMPMTLSPGQSVTVKVSAKPQSTAQTGTLTITSTANDPTVALKETATTPPPASHSASLTWSAPSTNIDPVDSYEVQRAASGSTQYSVIGTTAAASTAFTDTSVNAGQTYVYEVVSVDQSGNISKPSNTVTLTIP